MQTLETCGNAECILFQATPEHPVTVFPLYSWEMVPGPSETPKSQMLKSLV